MEERTLTMVFEAVFTNVDFARSALQGICAECFGTDRERASDITMAVNEAMNNAVEHTDATTVTVNITWSGQMLAVSVISAGSKFDPVEKAMALNEEDMLERDEGGYGLYIIRELVDRFEYEYTDSRNIWKLYKMLKSTEEREE